MGTSSPELPICGHAELLRPLDGHRLRLVGTYLPVSSLKKMPRPNGPREEIRLGHVVVVLEGSAAAYDRAAPQDAPAQVALGDAPRSADEIAAHSGRRVVVTGRLSLRPELPGPPATATLSPPIVLDPSELRLAE